MIRNCVGDDVSHANVLASYRLTISVVIYYRCPVPMHAGCTKSGTPKLARTHKPLKPQLFELSSKPLEGFKNGKIIYWLRLDTQNHVPEVLS